MLKGDFLKFFKEKKDFTKILIVLALGLILMFLGNKSEDVVEPDVGIEEKIATACSGVDGVGDCSVLVYYAPQDSRTDEAKVESVIVICEGADSVEVRFTLTEMLSSFFGIGANRIRVEKMKK